MLSFTNKKLGFIFVTVLQPIILLTFDSPYRANRTTFEVNYCM